MKQLDLFVIKEENNNEKAIEYPKCRHCGSDKGSWFSRTIPMGNFCENCGGPWTELDGVD